MFYTRLERHEIALRKKSKATYKDREKPTIEFSDAYRRKESSVKQGYAGPLEVKREETWCVNEATEIG